MKKTTDTTKKAEKVAQPSENKEVSASETTSETTSETPVKTREQLRSEFSIDIKHANALK
jgi:hypothetical protein